jgi:hypothetical protein
MVTPQGDDIETVDGLAVRSGKIEFDPTELRTCGRCGRSNAPNRGECIYCGAALAGGDLEADLKLRAVEPWERAFNVVLVGGQGPEEPPQLPIAYEILRRASELDPPAPVARVATLEMGEVVRAKLEGVGFKAAVFSDEDLAPERPPARLRSLSVDDAGFSLTTFNTGERLEFPAASLELVVVGRLFEKRSEQTLKRNRKDVKETDVLSISSDSAVVDIYPAEAPNGFRILESGFDFSCLGSDKRLLAAENMAKLVNLLKSITPNATVSFDYLSKRILLDEVWPAQLKIDSNGVKRSGFGVTLAKAEVTSNTEQFTKYSRLVRQTL